MLDPDAKTMNAAGIADAVRALVTAGGIEGARLAELTDLYQGWIGVLSQVAEAGALMEGHRVRLGSTATWGGELPYLYDVWDAIARGVWTRLGQDPLERIVAGAIESATVTRG